MSPTLLHLILALCLLILTLVVGFVSMRVVHLLDSRGGKSQLFLSLLNCFAGGVFLAVCFLDMVPDVNEKYGDFINDRGKGYAFAWPQFFTCIGFFLVYVVEEGCFTLMSQGGDDGHGHSHSHSHSHEPFSPVDASPHHSQDKLFIEAAGHSHGGHGHSHGTPPSGSLLRAITFAVAISFHSLLEGFALGVQKTTSGTVTLFISLLLHKGVEAFSVGLQVSKDEECLAQMKAVITTIIVYSLMSPIGTVIGTLVETSNHIKEIVKDGVIMLLEALANGSFVYVTFLEVLAEEKANRKHNILKLIAIFVGFIVISVIMYIFADEAEEVGCPTFSDLLNSTTSTLSTEL